VWEAPAAQGFPHHRGAQPVRDPAAGQSAVVALWLPTSGQPDVQPPGRGVSHSGHARVNPDPDRLAPPDDVVTNVRKEWESLKWFCWHGNIFRALQITGDLVVDLDVEEPSVSQAKPLKAVREFDGYLRANAARIPNYGERRRAGEAISTAFVESTVNQVISKRMVKNNKCAGHPVAPTCCSRSAPGCSTTTWPPNSTAGIRRRQRASPTSQK